MFALFWLDHVLARAWYLTWVYVAFSRQAIKLSVDWPKLLMKYAVNGGLVRVITFCRLFISDFRVPDRGRLVLIGLSFCRVNTEILSNMLCLLLL